MEQTTPDAFQISDAASTASWTGVFLFSSFFDDGDSRNPANQLIWELSHYLQGFIHPRWLAGFVPSTVLLTIVWKLHDLLWLI